MKLNMRYRPFLTPPLWDVKFSSERYVWQFSLLTGRIESKNLGSVEVIVGDSTPVDTVGIPVVGSRAEVKATTSTSVVVKSMSATYFAHCLSDSSSPTIPVGKI